ncbi:MAG: deoxyribodipyrimidine photo-lyase [Burkholderiales bacterium]|nr:deoxyribodipyrimidine photo-lyase [Burkholderiales bacterium]
MSPPLGSLVWFRRDLRDHDHAALSAAITDEPPVWCAFVLDREILDALPSRTDRRVEFIRESLTELDAALRRRGGGLIVRHAHARDEIPALAARLGVAAVYANHDHEPAAIDRDAAVGRSLDARGIAFRTGKDHLVFERGEILTRAGTPYTVFTPYRRAWLAALTPAHVAAHDTAAAAGALAPPPPDLDDRVPALGAIGFHATDLASVGVKPGMSGARTFFRDFRRRVDGYADTRDFPAVRGPSYLSTHLRFGTVSVRELVGWAHARALERDGRGAATWLSELVWREFYAQILWHFPHVAGRAFRPAYDTIAWPDPPGNLDAWRAGRTGYPIVDAAMRQLARTGYMHNRLRMIAASFLAKDLHVDWRSGERHFADLLLDYELASNNGGWQWAASTGCDAQPYFRVFNPVAQSRRFDPRGAFIRRYVPEIAALGPDEIHAPWTLPPAILAARGVVLGRDYPPPIVDHATARQRALELYGRATAPGPARARRRD